MVRKRVALALLSLVLGTLRAAAASYPDKPVRLVIAFPPGGSTGYTAKVLSDQLQKILGRPFVIDVRTGDFGINAVRELVGKTDGYTLMVGSIITNSMTPVIRRANMGFDYDKEILAVTRLADFPSVVMIRSSVPADTVKDFLAWQKKTSGKLTFGTDFLGTFVDVDAIMLGKAADLKVAYHANNGAIGILADLVDGKIDMAILNVATASANVDTYKALAVTGPQRLTNFPGVPTMAESGFAGIGTGNWQGLFVPRGTPAEIVGLLHTAAVKAMNAPESRQAFDKVNAAIATSPSPDTFVAEISAEMLKWEKLIPEIMTLPQE
jgi:tripartite-type tricarboxylate transporter receptor subunit TctC